LTNKIKGRFGAPFCDHDLEISMLKQALPLFQSPVLVFEKAEGADLNRRLLAEFDERRRRSDGISRSNRGGWHSEDDFFRRQEPASKELAQFIVQSLTTAERQYVKIEGERKAEVKLEGWINVNPRSAFNAPHTHPNFAWSGCYYVNQPVVEDGRSGAIEFLDPRAGIGGWPMTKSELTRTKVTMRPKPGTLLIFPSYLVHWVYPNEQEEERVSVAFNARLRYPD
jgi:uncharacterized protein (TIGR02466 family)